MPAGCKGVSWPVLLLLLSNMINVDIGFSQPNSLSVAMTNRKAGKAWSDISLGVSYWLPTISNLEIS